MSLPATEYSTTSFVSPYTPTIQPTGCPFSPRVLLTSSSGTCRTDCRLQLNPDKSEALIVGTANQLHAVTSAVTSVSVAGVDLSVANDMKALGVVLHRRLTFRKHAMAVAQSCNYHSQAIRHIRHLLSTELAVTLACSLILFTARCYASAVYAVMQCPSVRPSVTFVDHVKTNKHIFEIFSLSGSDTILVFPYRKGWRYSDGNPLNGSVECKGA